MALDQIFSVVKEYFPATLGAILGAWNKRGEKGSLKYLLETSSFDKLLITIIAAFAILVGISIGRWVSVALTGYYDLPEHVIPILEFVTALNGIKLVDSVLKGVDKTLDIINEKLPKFISNIIDVLELKIKKWFG
jgi:hypothetical protein